MKHDKGPRLPGYLPERSEHAKQRGIDRVAGRCHGWMKRACEAINRCCTELDDFTADDAQERLQESPGHANAWGAAFTIMARDGHIAMTGGTRKSIRVLAHSRRLQVWRAKGNSY